MGQWNLIEVMFMYKDLVLTQGRKHANTCLSEYLPEETRALVIACVNDDGKFLDNYGKPINVYRSSIGTARD